MQKLVMPTLVQDRPVQHRRARPVPHGHARVAQRAVCAFCFGTAGGPAAPRALFQHRAFRAVAVLRLCALRRLDARAIVILGNSVAAIDELYLWLSRSIDNALPIASPTFA